MTYKPPFARMRQIKRDAPAPLPRTPTNVEEALLEVPVGAVKVTIKPGPDGQLGTPDDEVVISKSTGGDSDIPKYDMTLRKADLVALAEKAGLDVEEGMTKANIIEALDAHFGK